MCRILCELLDAHSLTFKRMIQQLETASDYPRVDINLATEISAKSRAKIQQLGLDPDDTTGTELYHALNDQAHKHDKLLVDAIGANTASTTYELAIHLKTAVDRLNISRTAWSLKAPAAKQLLKNHPPRNVMKNLGYRSVDSMLKRESLIEIYIALQSVQSQVWLKNFYESYRKLGPGDFTESKIEIVVMQPERWKKLTAPPTGKFPKTSICVKELGAIVVSLPDRHYFNGIALAMLPWLVEHLNQIRFYSAYFKLHHVKTDFGARLSDTLLNKQEPLMTVGGQSIYWPLIQQHFSQHNDTFDLEIFEPHLQKEDLIVYSPAQLLSQIDPRLEFWTGLEFVAADYRTKTTSFNIMDVATNYVNGLDYSQRMMSHFRASLWSELLLRYARHEPFKQQLVQNLNQILMSKTIKTVFGESARYRPVVAPRRAKTFVGQVV